MEVVSVIGTLITLALSTVLIVGMLMQHANRQVARVPVVIDRNNSGLWPMKDDRTEHVFLIVKSWAVW